MFVTVFPTVKHTCLLMMAPFKCMLSKVSSRLTLLSLRSASCRACERTLKDVLKEQIPERIKMVTEFRKQHDKTKLGEITMGMLWGGMRGMKALICDTSVLDAEEGIRFRGMSIPEVRNCLPKAAGGEEPLPEGIFWLMATGEIPTTMEVQALSKDLAERSEVPKYIVKMLKNFPPKVHPMAQFSAAITAMNADSLFAEAYSKGVDRSKYWEYIYEDSINLIAKLPGVAALIYLNLYRKGKQPCAVDCEKDWSYNFAHMLGYTDCEFIELLRLYLTIHTDHEGGNVSAHATHLVGSALADPYLSFAAGMNGLAGPLHGLANQNVLIWLMEAQKEMSSDTSEEEVKAFVEKSLKTQVVPGYGHAVLRKTDPRFTAQQEFALKHIPDDPLVQLTAMFYKVVPPVLTALGKVQNPWPNVDAHSGVLLYHYGMTEMKYYTVLFGVSRALGVLAQLIWSRALRFPIERPKSMSAECLMRELKFEYPKSGQKPCTKPCG